jgi:flagellar protein FlaF
MRSPAQTYAKTAQDTSNPRELEAQLLMRAASKLQAVIEGSVTETCDMFAAIRYNRRLWLLFADTLSRPENTLPMEIKKNVTSLAAFVVNRSIRLETSTEAKPELLGVLININREIAAGLRSNAA